MKPLLDIVVCYSILEQVLGQDMLLGSSEKMALALHIRRHRMLVSERLMDLCEQYFTEHAPDMLELYRTYCSQMISSETSMRIVPNAQNTSALSSDPYYAELIGICINGRDKLLLSEKKDKLIQITAKKAKTVHVMNTKDILQNSFDNPLFLYTLPISGLMLRETQTNEEISLWLKRFFEQETYVQIFENYLFTDSSLYGFEHYILPYLLPNAELQIYTLESDTVTEEIVKKTVQKKKYQNRKIEVFFVFSKRDLHERRIQGENFIIQFDKGFSVFGKDGKIQKSPIDVMETTLKNRTVILEGRCRQVL